MVVGAVKIAIVIPARWGSTRFPGKPLAKIAGKTMLRRVVEVAREAAGREAIDIIVTTEDQRIAKHAKDMGVECIITPADCPTGSDRVLAAVKAGKKSYDFIVNLQGDAPFTPPQVVRAVIDTWKKNTALKVVTPVHRLSWEDLDRLQEAKKKTPFSGTTAAINDKGQALWFSKTIIPAIRKEQRKGAVSPVYQHIGIYGFRMAALEKFCALPQSHYEKIEGLEQLRLIENGIPVQAVAVTVASGAMQGGIDSPEDLKRAEAILKKSAPKKKATAAKPKNKKKKKK